MAFDHYKTNKNVVLTVSKILLNNWKVEKFKDVNVTSEGSTVGAEVYIYSRKWLWQKWVAMREKSILKISTDLGSLHIKTIFLF